ncbi:STAS domain-containing protein [Streptomyces erythrochromogenes]|uniref:STAS domain-containing protein n=1 Tax=Streptomyces erythrochromogenes TaxID=285574 RepID=UPI00368B9219
MDFRVMPRRYGPTVCLAPAGELDLESRSVLDGLYIGASEATVVACDMLHLTFMDVSGLDGLIAFADRLEGRGIRFFAYNWQPQPSRLLDLVDALFPPPAGTKGIRGGPIGLLRRSLHDSAVPHRTVRRTREHPPGRTGTAPGHG